MEEKLLIEFIDERGGNWSVALLRIVEVVDLFYYWGSVVLGQWKLNFERRSSPEGVWVFLELLLLLLLKIQSVL